MAGGDIFLRTLLPNSTSVPLSSAKTPSVARNKPLKTIGRALLLFGLILLVVAVAAWASLALWYRLPLPEVWRAVCAGIFALGGLATVVGLFGRRRASCLSAFAVASVLVIACWTTITPPSTADWAPDVARQVTGRIEGNQLTLSDVRAFDWRSDTDFTPHWESRSYDLGTVRTVDLFMSYWSGPLMAHMIVSFGFADGRQLAWSIEVRRRKGGAFSPIADLFKSNPLVIIAADERDVVGVRSNVRGEDVQLYRMNISPAGARALLLAHVADANALAEKPKFYNSLTTNCTTAVIQMVRAVGDALPFDWRLIVNGYVPDYAYDQKALDTRLPLEELKRLSHIDDKAKADGLSPAFSAHIREGVPAPLPPDQTP
ncbi:DUF4105 domain-containing protein [Rhizobium sp. rho-13.1]|nr:DUF4105 domain-containing protein [Rhizobium sp. rho-13.1]TQY19157.1 DUF4105 domain-containing protein [Rhizobium sp. rho-1.1]